MKPFFLAALLSLIALAPIPAGAAAINLVSMYYSKAHPVPHFHYEGETEVGDVQRLQQLMADFVHCGIECSPETGRSSAVLTMNGPGGSYHEGLRLADFLRANNVATVIEKGAECYSACAFSFLGGTGYSSNERIGYYVDRVVEPGAVLGFHSPYRDPEALAAVLLERTPTEVMTENRDALSLMVKELVKWNVDPEIIHHMVNQGPSSFYILTGADDFYLTRTALPPIPTGAWIEDIPSAVKNACVRLLALLERADPLELRNRITTDYEQGIGTAEFEGSLSGYRLSDRLLDIGHCSATDRSIATGNDLEVALYMNPGIDGHSLPVLRMFSKDDYFSSAGIGGSPLKRVYQRGGLGHWFLPVGVAVGSLENNSGILILADKFFTISRPELPPLAAGVTQVATNSNSRVSNSGNVWLFEQVGSTELYDAALADSSVGVTLTHDSVTGTGFIRQGTHADGTAFSVTGFKDGASSIVVRTLVLSGGVAPTTGEATLVRQLQCGVALGALKLAC